MCTRLPLTPSHTAAPARLQTDLLAVSPQRSRCLSLAAVRPSRAAGRRTAAARSPETESMLEFVHIILSTFPGQIVFQNVLSYR